MEPRIVVFDPEEASAEAIENLVKIEGFSGFCAIVKKKPDIVFDRNAAFFSIGASVEGREEINFLNFPRPLRAGALLQEICDHARKSLNNAAPVKIGPYQISNGGLVNSEGKAVARLTEKEALILSVISGSPGGKAQKEELLKAVWGYAPNIETHTLETHIYRLRQKIEKDPANPEILLTTESGYEINS